MTTQLTIVGGPSREDVFDCLRLASIHCLLPLSFKLAGPDGTLTLPTVLELERMNKDPRTLEFIDWRIKSEAEMPHGRKEPNDPMFQQYAVEIFYSTKTRTGIGSMTRIEGKTSRF